MPERPSIRQLEYLVALADTLNFRRAAERCFVSQPAMSAQIQKLEDIVGTKLFERDPRRVLITPAGAEATERAKAVLAACDDFTRAITHAGDPLAGRLRLGVIPTVAPYVLPKVLPIVRQRFPKLELLIREERTASLVDELDAGRLDLLLLALEADLRDAETLLLFEEAFVLALPKGHALGKRTKVTQQDLAGVPVLLLEDGHCLRASTLEVCRAGGAFELVDFRATSLNTLVQMVASGVGVTLLPEMAATIEARGAELEVRPFAAPAPVRRIGLAWRPSSPRKAAFRVLAEALEPQL
ncbi:MAG: LysR family transcriptional regulator [Planctomycetes bacterium]|nr:LysR family transcriptional regulator [Planctomycetota bacterium]